MSTEFEELRQEAERGDYLETSLEVFGRFLNRVTTRKGEWCGTPIPIPGMGLVVEDRHPYAASLRDLQKMVDQGARLANGLPEEDATASPSAETGWITVNSWHGPIFPGLRGYVRLDRHTDGRTRCRVMPDGMEKNRMLLDSFEVVEAWDLEAELAALERLRTLVTPYAFKSYMTTGGFYESSKRSQLTYLFRRLHPTLVISDHFPGEVRFLCALCLHPLAFYSTTRSGAMVPTDDVIAHLVMMRADEPKFWARSNQHSPETPEAGL